VNTLTRFEQDLRLLTDEQLKEKYGENWSSIDAASMKIAHTLEEEHEAEKVANSEDPFPEIEPPAPPYRGRAFGRFVMIRRLEAEHTGRLVMPSRIAGTSDVGWVASVGEECKYIKQGQIVAFDQYASVGRELRLIDADGLPGTFLIVEEPDIMAILEKV
jgi:co-chaperonin GroES (HSP10)